MADTATARVALTCFVVCARVIKSIPVPDDVGGGARICASLQAAHAVALRCAFSSAAAAAAGSSRARIAKLVMSVVSWSAGLRTGTTGAATGLGVANTGGGAGRRVIHVGGAGGGGLTAATVAFIAREDFAAFCGSDLGALIGQIVNKGVSGVARVFFLKTGQTHTHAANTHVRV